MDAAKYRRMEFTTIEDATVGAWEVLRENAGKMPWEVVRIERQQREVNDDVQRLDSGRRYRWVELETWETTADGEDPYRL